jgi:hypothetical protein
LPPAVERRRAAVLRMADKWLNARRAGGWVNEYVLHKGNVQAFREARMLALAETLQLPIDEMTLEHPRLASAAMMTTRPLEMVANNTQTLFADLEDLALVREIHQIVVVKGSLPRTRQRSFISCGPGAVALSGGKRRRVYLAMSRRSVSLPACVSFNLVPRSSSRPQPFRRLSASQSISRSRSSPSATCFSVSFSDGLRARSGVLEDPFPEVQLCPAGPAGGSWFGSDAGTSWCSRAMRP